MTIQLRVPTRHQAITKSDVTTYTGIVEVRADGAGTLVLTDAAGTDVTYTMAAGASIKFSAVKIKAASTATGISAMF